MIRGFGRILAVGAVLAAATVLPALAGDDGPTRLRSAYPFAETLDRLRAGFGDNGLRIFAEIDHAEAARGAGLDMPPTVVLIYGNPAAGTPLMQDSPDLALDLPLRVLVRQDIGDDDAVTVVFHPNGGVRGRHGLTGDKAAALAKPEALIARAIGAQLP
ncbi:DUF302 domain-containing protein [Paracoccus sp. p4-l81]|uniref:DUF302 domain-containing protein n=1 Tax=unclassified Paracoccus (in: a-proteobacteria) TaxID=2688777 RepID=UPI0035B7E481